MKVAHNPGFNQAPSMLNKRAQGSKFSFPVDESNSSSMGSNNNGGFDFGGKTKGGNSNKF